MKDYENQLADLLQESARKDKGIESILAGKFFNKWFRNKGSSYVFIFKKNIKVTNIQHAELLSLVKTNITDIKTGKIINNIQFLSVFEFNDSLEKLINDFPVNSKFIDKNRFLFIAKHYFQILKRMVIVDSFYGSSVVFVNQYMNLNYKEICASSGYIHSTGINIFIRKVSKTKKREFITAIEKYVRANYKKSLKAYFVLYTHEDFTSYDREVASELRDGLDDLKYSVEKYHMGTSTLVEVISELGTNLKGLLEIPIPGNFKVTHNKFNIKNIDKSRTIWLIMDRNIDENTYLPGIDPYYICYDQHFINHNPYHIMDENKPAWNSHTTVPHTLVGAMINLSKEWCPTNRKICLVDPFSGTGTTCLESMKYSNIKIECGDIDPLSRQMTIDNMYYFSLDKNELDIDIKLLRRLINKLDPNNKYRDDEMLKDLPVIEPNPAKDTIVSNAHEWVDKLFTKTSFDNSSVAKKIVTETTLRVLLKKTEFERVVFYLALRAHERHHVGIERESLDKTRALLIQTQKLTHQLLRLKKLREKEESKCVETDGMYSIFIDKYSKGITVCRKRFKKRYKQLISKRAIKTQDVRKLRKKGYDVIITDPPYGFNKEFNPYDLARLYSDSLAAMIRALKNNGQLLISLPERSHIGKESPFVTHKELVKQQVLFYAEKEGKEVINTTYSLPIPSNLFRAPYYWESEKALKRSILHFVFRSKNR